jgi:hypothetical protein
MPQVHYKINFEIVSQRFNDDNIFVEQACADIKNQTFLNFHCRYMVIFNKFLDFVIFERKDLGHISAKTTCIIYVPYSTQKFN